MSAQDTRTAEERARGDRQLADYLRRRDDAAADRPNPLHRAPGPRERRVEWARVLRGEEEDGGTA